MMDKNRKQKYKPFRKGTLKLKRYELYSGSSGLGIKNYRKILPTEMKRTQWMQLI
jgi:hypothetical protein